MKATLIVEGMPFQICTRTATPTPNSKCAAEMGIGLCGGSLQRCQVPNRSEQPLPKKEAKGASFEVRSSDATAHLAAPTGCAAHLQHKNPSCAPRVSQPPQAGQHTLEAGALPWKARTTRLPWKTLLSLIRPYFPAATLTALRFGLRFGNQSLRL